MDDDFDKSLGDMPTMGDEPADIDLSLGDIPTMGESPDGIDQTLSDIPTMAGAPVPKKRKSSVAADVEYIAHIDRYKFIKQIGRGAFGAVFLAHDTVADTLVALKTLPPELNHSPEDMEAVRDNFKLVSKLSHPNIAQLKFLHKVENVHNEGENVHIARGEYLVVMEYAEGSTLFKWMRQFEGKKVPFDKALDICQQVAKALDYAHSQKIIHRDIKPGNIMLSPTGQVKVLDFGLAAEINSSMSRLSTDKGSTSGTRPYMPPEQLQGKKQDQYADQYALAVMFYEMISGSVPFQGVFETSDMQLILGVVPKQAPDPLKELDKKKNRILLKALSKVKYQRYTSCLDFTDAMAGKAISGNKKSAKILLTAAAVIIAGTVLFKMAGPESSKEIAVKPNGKGNIKNPAKTGKSNEPKKKLEINGNQNKPVEPVENNPDNSGKLSELLSKARQALNKDDITAASTHLAELFKLDANNIEGLNIQKEINSKANLEKVIPVKSEADFMKTKAAAISRADGFDELLDNLEKLIIKAENYFQSKSYPSALKAYSNYNLEMKQLIQNDKDRKDYKSKTGKFDTAVKGIDFTELENVNPSLHLEYIKIDSQRLKSIAELNFTDAGKSLETCISKLAEIDTFLKDYNSFTVKLTAHKSEVSKQLAKLPKENGGPLWQSHTQKEQSYKAAAKSNDFTAALKDMAASLTDLNKYVTNYESYTNAKASLDKNLASYSGPRKGSLWNEIQKNIVSVDSAASKYDYEKAVNTINSSIDSQFKNIKNSYKNALNSQSAVTARINELGGEKTLSSGIKTWASLSLKIDAAKQKIDAGSFSEAAKDFTDIKSTLEAEAKYLKVTLTVTASDFNGRNVTASVYKSGKFLAQTPYSADLKYDEPYSYTVKYTKHKDKVLSGKIDFFGSKTLNAKLSRDGSYLGKIESINTDFKFVVFRDLTGSLKEGNLVKINGLTFKTGRLQAGKVSLVPQTASDFSKVKVGDEVWKK